MTKERRTLMGCATALTVATAVAGSALACASMRFTVAQRGRAFLSDAITVQRGDTLEIVNDESTAMHHAYIDDPSFSFDVGDQEPGGKADIRFTTMGTFTVLCGIHPRMKLVVVVEK